MDKITILSEQPIVRNVNHTEEDLITVEVKDLSKVSDGYHTIEELYDHRCLLFLAVLKTQKEPNGWISKRHSDGSTYEGWFVAGYYLDSIDKSITYHLPNKYWDLALDCKVFKFEKAPDWDGHTADDVLKRLKDWITK